jgi:branched-chain amino acid transport system permease protein
MARLPLEGRRLWIAGAGALLLLVAPLVAPQFPIYVLTSIFIIALLAMSLNLVLGFGGIYQFHHAAFYGVGAYTVALIATKTGLPSWVGFIAAPLVAALTGLLIGWFCVRLTALYFGMLQISLGSLLWVLVFRWYDFTGGDNGIHEIPVPAVLGTLSQAYYVVLAVVALCLLAMYVLVHAPFGATLQAIRDNAARCEAVGINVRRHQLLAITLAAFFAGVAGALFAGVEKSVFPNMLFWGLSLEILVMCLLGGWFTFSGPLLGAAIVVILRTLASRYTDYWTTILGVILILLIFFLPDGIMGFVQQRLRRAGQPSGERA